MAATPLSQRLATTRRSQTRVLAGEQGQSFSDAVNEAGAGEVADSTSIARQSYDSLARDFDSLLPVIAKFYGYEEADIAQVRRFVLLGTDAAHSELLVCVLHWRLDVVVHQLGGLAEDVAERAWIQFRLSVMGVTADDDGIPYPQDALEAALRA